ncbi:hypothetical protein [Dyadobacter sp. MSC1_007]|jgi:hypothetical protein|uniref:hypothetical protein n=1 Tax=Dyadobacter sp. MSC1_007 TaxID=2909264 RepID=UPI00202EAAF7|nr:hypothetical protein [Dyadobacter sp. MSC1_007]
MNKYSVTIRGRYTRLLYLITPTFNYNSIQTLVIENQTIWGGRFHPIIQVDENRIPPEYINWVENHDPDIIYYDVNVDIASILTNYNINPYYTEPLNLETPWHAMGTNTYFLASEFKDRKAVFPGSKYWQIKDDLKDWYAINFGISNHINNADRNLTRENSILEIDSQNYEKLLSIIATDDKLLFKTMLSQLYSEQERDIVNNQDGSCLEFIVGGEDSREDLLYYVNRALYKNKGLIYFTISQFQILIKNADFWVFIRSFRFLPKIKIKSYSHSEVKLLKLVKSIPHVSDYKIFEIQKDEKFPYELNNEKKYPRYSIFQSTQTIITSNGFINIPKLPKSIIPDIHGWSIDIDIRDLENTSTAPILLPKRSKTQFIIGTQHSRTNSNNTISILVDRQVTTTGVIGIHIPTAEEIIKFRITGSNYGITSDNKIQRCTPSDDSNRLLGFMKIFSFDFTYIEKLFNDYFWGNWIIDTSKKENTYPFSTATIVNELTEALTKTGNITAAINGPNEIGANLPVKVKNIIGELCEKNILLKGFKIKCKTCSSNIWYSLDRIKNEMICTGCHATMAFPIDSEMHYVINELVRKNIYRESNTPDGNYTVIRSLAKLKEYYTSFYFTPQLDLFTDQDVHKPLGDLDLVCVGDGKFIIGECKHNSEAFMVRESNGINSLDKLVSIAKMVQPDIIVLACAIDKYDKLQKAGKYVKHKLHNRNIMVQWIKIIEKSYFSMDYIYR